MCDEGVMAAPGTRTCPTDFSGRWSHTAIIGRCLFLLGECRMRASNRAEYFRDLAEESRRLAVTSFSIQMRNRYWRMAEHYNTLAEAEGLRALGLSD